MIVVKIITWIVLIIIAIVAALAIIYLAGREERWRNIDRNK